MSSQVYQELKRKLVEAGVPKRVLVDIRGWMDERTDPVHILASTKLSALPFEDLLLDYARRLEVPGELAQVVGALSERGMKRAGRFFVEILRDPIWREEDMLLWHTADGLRILHDPSTYRDIVEFCWDRSLGRARQMLFEALPWTKVSSACEAAVAALDDPTVRGHAIEALGRFRRPEIIPILESLPLQKGLYEWRARETAVRRLQRVAGRG